MSFFTSNSNPRRFFTGVALPLLAAALLCAASRYVLMSSHEYDAFDKVITRQEQNGGLYGSSLYQRVFYYKQRLYNHTEPAVTALGSSRVLQITAHDFSVPFVNLGSMSDLDEVIEITDKLFTAHKPDMVLFGIDYWWLHPQAETKHTNRDPENITPSLRDILSLPSWLPRGKITTDDIRTILNGTTPHNGISAIVRGDGYSVDGAYHYTSTLHGKTPSEDAAFANSFKKIAKGDKIFAYSDHVSDIQIGKLRAFLQKLKDANIKTVLFLPPLPAAVTRNMDTTGGYGYVEKLRAQLPAIAAEYGMEFFDYHDATKLRTSDCEFIDGHHGGPVVYQRILLDMAIASPDVQSKIRLADIGWNIEHFKGQASLQQGEVDFLKLGCIKGAQTP